MNIRIINGHADLEGAIREWDDDAGERKETDR